MIIKYSSSFATESSSSIGKKLGVTASASARDARIQKKKKKKKKWLYKNKFKNFKWRNEWHNEIFPALEDFNIFLKGITKIIEN